MLALWIALAAWLIVAAAFSAGAALALRMSNQPVDWRALARRMLSWPWAVVQWARAR